MIRRFSTQVSTKAKQFLDLDAKYNGGRFYQPLPIVISHAKGAYAWDVDGKKYTDFVAGYGAVNQGHCHPAIFKALED